jgi:hypothetical protein
MRVRLMGTDKELDEYVARFQLVFDVLEVSEYYPNRNGSQLKRAYLEIALTAGRPTVVHASAVRTDRQAVGESAVRAIEPQNRA